MLSRLTRVVDALLSRGEGLDAHGDPYAPPLPPKEVEVLLERIRGARFTEPAPPFVSPIAPPGGSTRVPLIRRHPREGHNWAVLVLPYGSFSRSNGLGVYEVHAAAFRRQGYGVATMPLPFHGSRGLGRQPSGWGFVRADLGLTSRAIAAAAAEVTALLRHLREREGAARVVGVGASLGGEALGLAAALGAPVDALGFVAAVDNPASFYATGANREARRRTLAQHGVGMDDVARAFASFSPSSYPPPLPPGSLHFAIPGHDAVVPPDTQEAWRRAWDGTRLDLPWHAHASALTSPGVAFALARRVASA